MNDRIIVTNNPMLAEEVKDIEMLFVKHLSDVYLKSRDLVHQNWKLISHPLAGSIKPAQNPYRSIILAQAEKLDFYSLNIIEKAVQKLEQFNKNQKKKEYSKKIKKDYQLIDLALIKSAFNN